MKKIKLAELVRLKVGSPQFRIKENLNEDCITYRIYNQFDLEEDLTGKTTQQTESKQIRTSDSVSTLKTGDLVFSFISGTAAIVTRKHEGYLYTQNYAVLRPSGKLDPSYLLYLLNEDKSAKRQFLLSLQGSTVLKYTVKQVRDLILPIEENIERQRLIGEIYQKQLRLKVLRVERADREYLLRIRELEEARKS
ncbi:restriction endonuclease subunit M [Streptococcus panodentis]|uniref:Restriction endonuclease subunit M n=1 Tax=Streptococcus panodentis TaxID=1581472 RepID=A0ABS5AZG4_9STRE|nr:restriction endonuclease subunit M [Streptococcus panodentis]MBP2621989.1 restriction endonuclease subunit M [Streptococcus panodentis]